MVLFVEVKVREIKILLLLYRNNLVRENRTLPCGRPLPDHFVDAVVIAGDALIGSVCTESNLDFVAE